MVDVVTVVGLACNSEPGRGSGNGGGISSLSHGGNGTVLVGILERDVGGYDGGNRVMVMEKRSAGGDGGNGNSGIVVV